MRRSQSIIQTVLPVTGSTIFASALPIGVIVRIQLICVIIQIVLSRFVTQGNHLRPCVVLLSPIGPLTIPLPRSPTLLGVDGEHHTDLTAEQ